MAEPQTKLTFGYFRRSSITQGVWNVDASHSKSAKPIWKTLNHIH
ncbi:unnamed protein product [Acanthoscelides obtectus]|uniref:Uncharacterized protein n=1 Tax=Acanthoscelides obtectus TaxID=200917 RepID=A0A9P0MH15_ACAOB|nr:unnamed protein product [Acanthoscelides obtectus]CAH2013995.1 unnamed protein product [Acanthoscelides obtectus]CAK1652075.1 hypothetical protein AOBTE_LOCUS17662 [Acanthoscelides obtectus]CAK1652104.1 hypothetical protein AOBTE_LOCUS17685 [Acanthoscelides obtectus]